MAGPRARNRRGEADQGLRPESRGQGRPLRRPLRGGQVLAGLRQ